MERVVFNALALAAAGSLSDICAFGDGAVIALSRLRQGYGGPRGKTIHLCRRYPLTSPRPNLVWRFVIPAVAAAANYGYKTKS